MIDLVDETLFEGTVPPPSSAMGVHKYDLGDKETMQGAKRCEQVRFRTRPEGEEDTQRSD